MTTGFAKRVQGLVAFALLLLPLAAFAQVACEYSCREKDLNGHALAVDSSAIGYESKYSIFECMYVLFQNVYDNPFAYCGIDIVQLRTMKRRDTRVITTRSDHEVNRHLLILTVRI